MIGEGSSRRRLLDLTAATALVLLNVLLYRKIIRLWWTYDDPFNLHLILENPFVDTFIDASVWPQQLFTPLMLVAFDAGLAAFGLNPWQWYVAQLVVGCAAVLIAYAAMRLYLDPGTAFGAAATFAAGVPVCSVITQLSTVHYFIALIFAALATIAYVVALRRSDVPLAVVSAVLYLMALLAKEVAISLPFLVLFLPERDIRSRMRYATGHAVAAVVYFLWRRAVLGTFLGAYGWVIETEEWPRLLLLLPWRMIQAAAGTHLALGLSLIAIMAIVIAFAFRTRRSLILMLVGALVVVGPILPVAKEVNRRYVYVPWLAGSVAFGMAASKFRRSRAAVAVLIVVPALTVMANRQEWGHEFGMRQRMSDEARFFFQMPTDGLLRRPATPPAVMRELNWLKTVHLRKPFGASWFFDDFFLCVNDVSGKRMWDYDTSERTLVEITKSIGKKSASHCSSIRGTPPLAVQFRFREPALYWSFGPYEKGRYTALLAEGLEAFEVPRRDALNMPGVKALPIRIRYDSPEGWTTYSPQFMLDFTKQRDYAWRR